jgi:hypothetical protein
VKQWNTVWTPKNLGIVYNALESIVATLGPDPGSCRENKCHGCKFEMKDALSSAKSALKEFYVKKK